MAQDGLVFASKFNPLVLAGEVAGGEDAAGCRLSKAERGLSLLGLAVGPAAKAASGVVERLAHPGGGSAWPAANHGRRRHAHAR